MTRIYTNAVLLVIVGAIASSVFCITAPDGLEKAAFLMAVGFAGAFLSHGMTFASRLPVITTKKATLFNLNTLVAATAALSVLAFALVGLDVTVYQDSVPEGIAVSTVGALSGMVSSLIDQDPA